MVEQQAEFRLVIEGEAIGGADFGRFMQAMASGCRVLLIEELEPDHGPLDIGLEVGSVRSGSIIAFLAIVCTSVVTFEDTRIAAINVIRRLVRAMRILLDYDLHEPTGERVQQDEAKVVEAAQDLLRWGGASQIELSFYGDNVNIFIMSETMATDLARKKRGFAQMGGAALPEPADLFIGPGELRVELIRCPRHYWCALVEGKSLPAMNGHDFINRGDGPYFGTGRIRYRGARPLDFIIEHFDVG